MKPQGKVSAEDQEQQDPMEFLQSDEENEEDEETTEEEKGNQGGAAKRRLQEQRERLHGALALIELANNLAAWAADCFFFSLDSRPQTPIFTSPIRLPAVCAVAKKL